MLPERSLELWNLQNPIGSSVAGEVGFSLLPVLEHYYESSVGKWLVRQAFCCCLAVLQNEVVQGSQHEQESVAML